MYILYLYILYIYTLTYVKIQHTKLLCSDCNSVPPAPALCVPLAQPLIVALQTFLNCVQQKTCSGLRYMTGAEARAEAFLALNHGAVGILWYEASAVPLSYGTCS